MALISLEARSRENMSDGSAIARAPMRVSRLRIARPENLDPPPLSPSDVAGLERPHVVNGERVVRVFLPGALAVDVLARDGDDALTPLPERQTAGLFAGFVANDQPYRLRVTWPAGVVETEDSYSFGPVLGDFDLHLISEGLHARLSDCLGARHATHEGVAGVCFAVWAPNARRVAVVGDFNSWDERRHPMRLRHHAGVWELFVPRLRPGERYKYGIIAPDGARLPLKADPVALCAELPPATASVVAESLDHEWNDAAWMETRAARQKPDAPISIYEVHLGSWLRPHGEEATWRTARERLLPYVKTLGFTHIEFLPLAEHPFGGSWGYQPLSLFAPTARHGVAEDFAGFVDACHQADIGVIIDWVPAHFPSDEHGLARFDGTCLYEHEDPREGAHPDWKTLVYNFGRREVRGFLTASALRWLEDFHVDGLRVDAVASMLYRDYSRRVGEWIPNIHGGRENLEAVDFLRHVNEMIGARCPGVMTIAEESTSWPGVTTSVDRGGLGFDYKWNMGWMNDTLRYIERDPIHRGWHHDEMTFGLCYAFSERYILPISHDEVVHGKHSLLSKMPGDEWRQRANLRAYFAFMWTHPGKKLLFMGCEFGQLREWNHDAQLDWNLVDDSRHAGLLALTRDLNLIYAREVSLHQGDAHPEGFRWLVGDDRQNSVFAFMRRGYEAEPIIVVVNLTSEPRANYRIGVPRAGYWREILNTDASAYGGSNVGNHGGLCTEFVPAHGEAQSIALTTPPLATIVLRFQSF
jgi:1,4-alpha-glucan branching enzyme